MFADIREPSQEENLPATGLAQSSQKIQFAPSALPPAVSDFKFVGVVIVEIRDRLVLQHEALEALKESTRNLEVAEQLLNVGNVAEAERLREEARHKRYECVSLMTQAGIDRHSQGIALSGKCP